MSHYNHCPSTWMFHDTALTMNLLVLLTKSETLPCQACLMTIDGNKNKLMMIMRYLTVSHYRHWPLIGMFHDQ